MAKTKLQPSLFFVFIFLFFCQAGYSQTAPPVPENQEQPKLSDKEREDLEHRRMLVINRILSVKDPETVKKLYDFFVVHDFIKSEYVDEKNSADLLRLSMIGLVDRLDPYSNLYVDEDAELINRRLSSEENFSGIGLTIMRLSGEIVITEVLENSPAATADLRPGDIILMVNSESVFGMSVERVSGLIKGEEGTPVVLEIRSMRFQKPRSVNMIRRRITVKSVSHRDLKDGIRYIKIKSFLPETSEEFLEILFDSIIKNKKGLIIDLRNNGGGLLSVVNEIVGFFVGPKKILVTEKRRIVDEQVVTVTPNIVTFMGNARANAKLPRVVVLVNNFSASASEIMAGNLKHYKIATLVGVRTFGKATVQNYVPLDGQNPANSRLIIGLTVARYYLPDGSDITGNGIQPDIEVELPEDFKQFKYLTNKDHQFQEALKILKTK